MDKKKKAIIVSIISVLVFAGFPLFFLNRAPATELSKAGQASLVQSASNQAAPESPKEQNSPQASKNCQAIAAKEDPMISPRDREKMLQPITDAVTYFYVPIRLEAGRDRLPSYPEDTVLTEKELAFLWEGLWNNSWYNIQLEEGGRALLRVSYYGCFRDSVLREDTVRSGTWRISGEKVIFTSRYINETYHEVELHMAAGSLWMLGGLEGEKAENGNTPFYRLKP